MISDAHDRISFPAQDRARSNRVCTPPSLVDESLFAANLRSASPNGAVDLVNSVPPSEDPLTSHPQNPSELSAGFRGNLEPNP